MSTVTATRKITVIATKGKSKFTLDFPEGGTWGDLSPLLAKEGFKLDDARIIESTQKHSFDSPNAVLPAGNFFIHIFPLKTKSGATKKAAPKKVVKKAAKKVAKKAAPKKSAPAKKAAPTKNTGKAVASKKASEVKGETKGTKARVVKAPKVVESNDDTKVSQAIELLTSVSGHRNQFYIGQAINYATSALGVASDENVDTDKQRAELAHGVKGIVYP